MDEHADQDFEEKFVYEADAKVADPCSAPTSMLCSSLSVREAIDNICHNEGKHEHHGDKNHSNQVVLELVAVPRHSEDGLSERI